MGRQAIRASLPPYYQGPNDGNGYPNLLIHFYVHYLYVLSLKHFAFSLISSTYVYIYIFFFTQATQGVLSMEARVFILTEKLQKKDAEHEKNMSEVLESAANNYKILEDEHFKNINIMKEVKERARTEEAK